MVTKRKRTDEQKKKPADTGKVARVEGPARRVVPKRVEPVKAPVVKDESVNVRRAAVKERPAQAVAAKELPVQETPPQAAAPRKPKKQRPKFKPSWPLVVFSIILVLLLLVVGVFSWDRWLRFDDAAEFQGEWQSHGSTAVVVIDGQTIKLTSDVAYDYTLDTGAKTITFTFGNMQGQGRYRFSLDRSQLVITDGEGYSGVSTLLSDIGWLVDQAVRAVQGQSPEEVRASEDVTVLDRLSHNAAAEPREGVTSAAPVADAQTGAGANAEEAAEGKEPAAETPATSGETASQAQSSSSGSATDPTKVFNVSDV